MTKSYPVGDLGVVGDDRVVGLGLLRGLAAGGKSKHKGCAECRGNGFHNDSSFLFYSGLFFRGSLSASPCIQPGMAKCCTAGESFSKKFSGPVIPFGYNGRAIYRNM